MTQWRAGLRVFEALALSCADLSLNTDRPTLRVRQDKGRKATIVLVHPEFQNTVASVQEFADVRDGRITDADRSTAWRWVKEATARAVELGALAPGWRVSTRTLRHSYARHLLMNGIRLNYLGRWLGHSKIETTLIYSKLVPNPDGSLANIP